MNQSITYYCSLYEIVSFSAELGPYQLSLYKTSNFKLVHRLDNSFDSFNVIQPIRMYKIYLQLRESVRKKKNTESQKQCVN